MKVNELFEAVQGAMGQGGKRGAYYAPTAIRPTKAGNVHIRGSVPDWLEAMGVDRDSMLAAVEAVKKSPEYKAALDVGLKDVTSERDAKNGTLAFSGVFADWNPHGLVRYMSANKFKVLANGKIDIVSDNEWHRHDLSVPKPRVVKGNPKATIEKTMRQSLERLTDVYSKRVAKAAKNLASKPKAPDKPRWKVR